MDLTNSYDVLKLCNKICRKNNKCNECCFWKKDKCLSSILHTAKDFDFYYKELITALEEYIADHPQKTYLEDFKEKFPNAKLVENGIPSICVNTYKELLGLERVKCIPTCEKHWNQVMD